MENNPKLTALVKLLDDSDRQTASAAMAELLSSGADIGPIVSALQESGDPLVRRRAHQLQAIMRTRQTRARLADHLMVDYSNLWQGLAELHLQWYDNDSFEFVESLWRDLFDAARGKYRPRTSRRLAEFMADIGFIISGSGELEADYYCVGAVLEDRVGADLFLSAIALRIACLYGMRARIVRDPENGFAMLDSNGLLIFPTDWRVEPAGRRTLEYWSSGMILRHAAHQLLMCAISTDSIRYVYTISSCLSKFFEKAPSDLLPYPYNGKPLGS